MRNLLRSDDPRILVGTETHDDAGVYQLTEDLAIVQTIDFFPPVVNDPFIYGQIAAANALSDIYAMGATPKTALNLVGYPDNEDPELSWLGDIIRGGEERCRTAGVAVLGGHTVRDAEIKFGYAVTGIVHPKQILTNASAQPGDKLVLTKGLGTGFVTTANKKEECPEDVLQAACASMVQLNAEAAEAMRAAGAHAATDITGFGLAGHSYEMADGSGTTLVIELARLPLLPGVEKLVKKAYRTRASTTNAAYVEPHLRIEGEVDETRLELFYDAQTSGGLLISVPAERAEELVENVRQRGSSSACIIGEVILKGESALILRP